MSFYGSYFTYNGKSCKDFGLSLYDIGNTGQDDSKIASVGKPVEDWIPTRSKSFYYGLQQNNPLEFNLVFGVDFVNCTTSKDFLTRDKIAEINNWLTGHGDSRKWLTIDQPDMTKYKYYCTITDMKIITHGMYPWGFECTVTCDSAYAYKSASFEFECSSDTVEQSFSLMSGQMVNELYRPKMTITPTSNTKGCVSVKNKSTGSLFVIGKQYEFINDKTTGDYLSYGTNVTIDVDNETGVIKHSEGLNLYDYFNFGFLTIAKGVNEIVLKGKFKIRIDCDFPVDVGA